MEVLLVGWGSLSTRDFWLPVLWGLWMLWFNGARGPIPGVLDKWVDTNPAPYELLSGLSSEQIAAATDSVLEELKVDGVPATLITDSDGVLLHIQWGPPTTSTLRELLRRVGPGD